MFYLFNISMAHLVNSMHPWWRKLWIYYNNNNNNNNKTVE